MSILNIQIGQVGLANVFPSICYIQTNDTIPEVEATGYLNEAVVLGYQFANGMIATVSTKPSIASTVINTGFYQVTLLSANWSLVPLLAGVTLPLSLQYGGTGASLVANAGGIFYSTSTAGAILAGTITARQMLQSGSTAAPAWSTCTWPATTTVNQLLYSPNPNIVSGLATQVSSTLMTDVDGVPGWVTTPTTPSTPTTQSFLSGSGTYTTPTGVTYIETTLVGGGSGAGGSGASASTDGNAGGDTTFGTLTAGGAAAPTGASGSGGTHCSGGTASGGNIFNIPGGGGSGGSQQGSGTVPQYGASGFFGGAGCGGSETEGATGGDAIANTGAGGAAGGADSSNGVYAGGNGGAGGAICNRYTAPSATYSYSVGAGGAGGTAGGSGQAGGAGGSGIIIVNEFYV